MAAWAPSRPFAGWRRGSRDAGAPKQPARRHAAMQRGRTRRVQLRVSAPNATITSLSVAARMALWKRMSGSAKGRRRVPRAPSRRMLPRLRAGLRRMAARRHRRRRRLDHCAHVKKIEDELGLGPATFQAPRQHVGVQHVPCLAWPGARARPFARCDQAFADRSLKASERPSGWRRTGGPARSRRAPAHAAGRRRRRWPSQVVLRCGRRRRQRGSGLLFDGERACRP